jgi:Protoporphyrinogen oxidase
MPSSASQHSKTNPGPSSSAQVRNALTDGDSAPDTPSGLFSFRDGLQTLPDALADALGDRITLNAPVHALRHDGSAWKATMSPADAPASTRAYDALVCTAPLHRLSEMKIDTSVDLSPPGTSRTRP